MTLARWMSDVAPSMEYAMKAAGTNQDAFLYLVQIGYCARVIDNVLDGDKEVTVADLMDAFEVLCSRIPTNPFYVENIREVQPLQTLAWEGWKQSNELVKGSQTDKIYAHVYRDIILELYPIVALLTQGYNAMIEVRNEMKEYFKDTWVKSLTR